MTPTTSPKTLGFSSERLERLSRHIESYLERNYLVGVNALILRKGQVAYAESFGHQERGGRTLNFESLFRIYSMTKPITSVAALMLYEQGRFMLDTPVATFLPAFKNTKVHVGSEHQGLKLEPQERPMTIRDLLTHTSGLSYGWYQDTPVDGLYRATGIDPYKMPLAEFVDVLAGHPLVFQPGSHWRYSTSTDVLARVIEVAANESFDRFLKTRIFEPLGMDDTAFGVPQSKAERLTSVYSPTEKFGFGVDYSALPKGGSLYGIDTPNNSRFVEPEFLLTGFSGGGGLVSTMNDYAKFAQMLLNKGEFEGARLLGRKTVELMSMNHVPEHIRPLEIGGFDMPGTGFGLGVSVLEDVVASGDVGSAGQYGWSGAAMTSFWIDPVEELIGLFMTQFMPNDFYELMRECRVLTYAALV